MYTLYTTFDSPPTPCTLRQSNPDSRAGGSDSQKVWEIGTGAIVLVGDGGSAGRCGCTDANRWDGRCESLSSLPAAVAWSRGSNPRLRTRRGAAASHWIRICKLQLQLQPKRELLLSTWVWIHGCNKRKGGRGQVALISSQYCAKLACIGETQSSCKKNFFNTWPLK